MSFVSLCVFFVSVVYDVGVHDGGVIVVDVVVGVGVGGVVVAMFAAVGCWWCR